MAATARKPIIMPIAKLICVFWDVQHGNATYVNTPANEHVVIDLGVGSYKGANLAFSPLLHLKRRYGIRQLDGVIITHPHRDHLDDIGNFDALNPRVLLRPKHLTDAEVRGGNRIGGPVVEQYLRINARYSAPVEPAADPFSSSRPEGHSIRTFTPRSCPCDNLNNHSVVTVISYAGSKLLIPGDNEPPSWEELLANPNFVSAIQATDVLLAPHHGRDSGFARPCSTTSDPA